MKKLAASILVFDSILLIFCLLAAPITFTGCGTPKNATVEAKTFYTFRSAYNAAKSAYSAHLSLVVKGHVSKENEAKADAAWNQFRRVFSLSLTAASQNWEALPPETLQKMLNDLLTLLNGL